MSDTHAERRDHWEVVRQAQGDVLIHGLGMGWLVEQVLLKPEVRSVTVVEIDPDVVTLVGWRFEDEPRVRIIVGDALTWTPPKGARWDVVWHDIWDNICGDNMKDMIRLHRRFGRRAGWQGSWCRWECERNR